MSDHRYRSECRLGTEGPVLCVVGKYPSAPDAWPGEGTQVSSTFSAIHSFARAVSAASAVRVVNLVVARHGDLGGVQSRPTPQEVAAWRWGLTEADQVILGWGVAVEEGRSDLYSQRATSFLDLAAEVSAALYTVGGKTYSPALNKWRDKATSTGWKPLLSFSRRTGSSLLS